MKPFQKFLVMTIHQTNCKGLRSVGSLRSKADLETFFVYFAIYPFGLSTRPRLLEDVTASVSFCPKGKFLNNFCISGTKPVAKGGIYLTWICVMFINESISNEVLEKISYSIDLTKCL